MRNFRLNWVLKSFCLFVALSAGAYSSEFIGNHNKWDDFYYKNNVVTIASTGRSGSTLLTKTIEKYASEYQVLKTHLLPPQKGYFGKIIFIFSDPNKSAESVFHNFLEDGNWGKLHFKLVETADKVWVEKISSTENQSRTDNLLAYDALGIYEHLNEWLYNRTRPSSIKSAQVMAIKYENLWDDETIEAIKAFLSLDHFELPKKRERGYSTSKFSKKEKNIRKLYNLGTISSPRYAAYDQATELWEASPPFQFFDLQ